MQIDMTKPSSPSSDRVFDQPAPHGPSWQQVTEIGVRHRTLAAAAVVLAFLPSAAFAQISLALSSASIAPGGTATLNLSLTSTTGSSPAGTQWTFAYSPATLTLVSTQAGPAAAAAGKSISCTAGAGTYQCLVWGLNSTTIPNGVIATATFAVAASATG